MKQRLTKLGLAAIGTLLLQAPAQADDYLYVYKNDASVQATPLSDVQRITFTDNGEVVVNTTAYPIDNVRKITVEPNDIITEIGTVDNVIANVYPNPTNDALRVESAAKISELLLIDLYGKTLLHATPRTQAATLQVSNLPSGVYFIQIITPQGKVTKKIIKQ
jgi:hypothetical protein